MDNDLPAAGAASDRRLYYVWGGVFTDMRFAELEPGTEESFGPFHTEAEAEQVWREGMRRKVDIAQHRLFVLGVKRPSGGAGSNGGIPAR